MKSKEPKKSFTGFTTRIFATTLLFLFVATFLIYSLLYFLLPPFYLKYKKSILNESLEKTIVFAQDNNIKEGEDFLAELSKKNSLNIFLYSGSEIIFFMPNGNLNGMRITTDNFASGEIGESKTQSFYSVSAPIIFKDGEVKINFRSQLQPVDEVSKVLVLFVPYIAGIILIMSFLISFIYSKVLTKPLRKLNSVAREMSKLDFKTKIEVNSKDEIGELGLSLNFLAENLQKTMAELEEVNRSLKDDIKKERKLEEARRTFIAIMSHELKSPITAIRGQLEGMILNIGIYKDRDTYLKRSLRLVDDLDGLVKEILTSSKLDEPNIKIDLKEIAISEKIETILVKFDYLKNYKKLKVELDIDPNLTIDGDYELLKKVFSNILENSFKYTLEEGIVRISLKEESPGRVVMQVFNTANMISQEDLKEEALFRAFYRGEKSRNRETGGSGLGLYIVKRILRIHHFKFKIENKDDGVLFTIELFPQ